MTAAALKTPLFIHDNKFDGYHKKITLSFTLHAIEYSNSSPLIKPPVLCVIKIRDRYNSVVIFSHIMQKGYHYDLNTSPRFVRHCAVLFRP